MKFPSFSGFEITTEEQALDTIADNKRRQSHDDTKRFCRTGSADSTQGL